ncbi:hypothetical protein LSAT2_030328 [Lamellibrachia satsuma]|nr:hypothetical protein LSAT2_030328 [Lamellibrachia satsuma]
MGGGDGEAQQRVDGHTHHYRCSLMRHLLSRCLRHFRYYLRTITRTVCKRYAGELGRQEGVADSTTRASLEYGRELRPTPEHWQTGLHRRQEVLLQGASIVMGVAAHLQLCLIVSMAVYCIYDSDAADYCFSETFSASCNGNNQVVLMRTASYGRMQAGRCISGQFGYIGCSTTVLSFLDRLCSGQRRCETPVAGLDRLANACSADFKSYLEANYDCVEVDNLCPTSSAPRQPLTGDQGYISVASSAQVAVVNGQRKCTVSIETSVGQQVQLKIYDFTRTDFTRNELRVEDSACPVTMAISENNDDKLKTVMLCSLEESRERVVATSDSNSVSVFVKFKERSTPHFLLYYKVVGCADLAVLPLTTHIRKDGMLTVTCNSTGDSWHLVCLGTVWLGQVGNCTDVHRMSGVTAEISTAWAFPNGIATVITMGVGIGTVLGFCLLAALCACRGRCLNAPDRHAFASNKLSEIQIPYPKVSGPDSLTQPTVSTSKEGQRVHVPLPPPPSHETTAVIHAPGRRAETRSPASGSAFTVTRVPLKDHVYDTVRQGQ